MLKRMAAIAFAKHDLNAPGFPIHVGYQILQQNLFILHDAQPNQPAHFFFTSFRIDDGPFQSNIPLSNEEGRGLRSPLPDSKGKNQLPQASIFA